MGVDSLEDCHGARPRASRPTAPLNKVTDQQNFLTRVLGARTEEIFSKVSVELQLVDVGDPLPRDLGGRVRGSS